MILAQGRQIHLVYDARGEFQSVSAVIEKNAKKSAKTPNRHAFRPIRGQPIPEKQQGAKRT